MRAVLGPRFTDRIVAVNVISTLVIAELVLLSVWLREDFLVDVALVFALLSFLAVVVVSRLVVSPAAEAQEDQRPEQRRSTERRRRAWYDNLRDRSLGLACLAVRPVRVFLPLCWGCSGLTMCSTGCTPPQWGTRWVSSAS